MNVSNKATVFDPRKPFQPSLIFVAKAKSQPYLKCASLRQAPALLLTHKHHSRLKMLARGKHSSLLQTLINYGRKTFYNTGPQSQCYETFFVRHLRRGQISKAFVHGNTFQHGHIITGKAKNWMHLKGAPLSIPYRRLLPQQQILDKAENSSLLQSNLSSLRQSSNY